MWCATLRSDPRDGEYHREGEHARIVAGTADRLAREAKDGQTPIRQIAMIFNSMARIDKRVVEAARAAGVAVMHAPITFAKGYGELSAHPYGILKGVVDGQCFVKDSWGAAIVDELSPHEGDIVIEGKRGLDTFASTNLDFILRSKGITTIALGGFLTNCCVESTMRTGYEKGYQVVTLTDCTAALSEEEQRLAVEKNYPMFSRPLSHSEFLGELAG